MEEEVRPKRQQQRRLNLTILDMVKKEETRKDHFPLPFINQVLEKLAGKSKYYFLDGFSKYMEKLADPHCTRRST
ncbi:hypothetical protein CR513_44091, partial [Mucuna pruriens]